MKPGIPWSVKGIEPEAREAAKLAARRAGLTLGEWLNSVIFDQSANNVDSTPADSHAWEDVVPAPSPRKPDLSYPEPSRPEPGRPAPSPRPAPERRDDALRLQDIAQQLAALAQQERHSAPVPAYERPTPSARAEFERVVDRIEENERQTVEALTAMNDRLSMLSRQIAQQGRPQGFSRPEEVPGYAALEAAIRNVVEHIEVSEKRTRDSLRVMQDRLAEMAERRAAPTGEDIQRAVPILTGLESRLADMLSRIQRSEGLMAERIEGIKSSAQQMANQAQSAAVTAVRGELREVETRVLSSLKEAQAAAANAPSIVATEIARLHGDMAGLAKRFDDLKAGTASERDLQSLRGAFEQLSARVAQGPDMRPLADMDRRLGDITRRLEQASAATGRDNPRVGVLEQRIAELDHRLADVIRLQGDQRAVRQIEQSIAAIDARLVQTEQQLGHIESMEQAIRQLYDSLEQTRVTVGDAAEAAASRALERYEPPAPRGPSPELRALEEGLRAVRESAAGAERRSQDTFEAVHETLAEIVQKIARLESGARTEAPRAAAPPPEPPRAAEPEREPEAEPPRGQQQPLSSGDDFIAAARRAAQAAAAKPSALRAEYAGLAKGGEEDARDASSILGRFRARTESGEAKAPSEPQSTSGRRKALIIAGILLLTAASVFAYRSLVAPQLQPPQSQSMSQPVSQPPKQAARIAAPAPAPKAAPAKTALALAPPPPAPRTQARSEPLSDPIVTGSLPAGALGRTLPDSSVPLLQPPPPETGTLALRSAAAAGDARAQFIVAGRYLDGDGIAQDFDKAFFWYRQSAASGLAPAQYRLGTLYELGKGTSPDPRQALQWYERAAQGGNVRAMHNAAVLAAGDAAGPADLARAFRLFRAAAERGFRDSQFNLAILFERGLGTRASAIDAYLWYSLAARQGDPDSGKRAATIAQSLPDDALKQADARLAAWRVTPTDDSGNVVTIIEPAWQDPSHAAASGQPS